MLVRGKETLYGQKGEKRKNTTRTKSQPEHLSTRRTWWKHIVRIIRIKSHDRKQPYPEERGKHLKESSHLSRDSASYFGANFGEKVKYWYKTQSDDPWIHTWCVLKDHTSFARFIPVKMTSSVLRMRKGLCFLPAWYETQHNCSVSGTWVAGILWAKPWVLYHTLSGGPSALAPQCKYSSQPRLISFELLFLCYCKLVKPWLPWQNNVVDCLMHVSMHSGKITNKLSIVG